MPRIAETLLAGAVGDALGAPYEGRPLVGEPVPGAVTDDTLLTLATCRAIVRAGRVDPATIAAEMVDMWRTQPIPGLGAATTKALRDLAAGQHWALAGAKGDRAAGNGAAMRIAPVALLLDPASDHTLLRDVARITHHNDEAWVGAWALALALSTLSSIPAAHDARPLLLDIAQALPDTNVRDALLTLGSAPDLTTAAAHGTSAWAAHSVPFAIYAACLPTTSMLDRLVAVVRSGGDTDTNASMTAQLLAQRGLDAPADHVARLPCTPELRTLGAALERLCPRPRAPNRPPG
jgi:ADP-ribosyl-[dinitrogen reductase] hydrolase